MLGFFYYGLSDLMDNIDITKLLPVYLTFLFIKDTKMFGTSCLSSFLGTSTMYKGSFWFYFDMKTDATSLTVVHTNNRIDDIRVQLTKNGILPSLMSLSISSLSTSPCRLKFLSVGSFFTDTAASIPDRGTDELACQSNRSSGKLFQHGFGLGQNFKLFAF